jgi:sporulation protein YqfC
MEINMMNRRHKAYKKKKEKSLFPKKKSKSKDSLKSILSDSFKYVNICSQNVSTLNLIDNQSLYIENYCGIIEYTTEHIKIHIKAHMLTIKGDKLDIDYFTNEDLLIKGFIKSITYT